MTLRKVTGAEGLELWSDWISGTIYPGAKEAVGVIK